MAEYEVEVHLDGEVEINIETKDLTYSDKLELIKKIILDQTLTFDDIYVELIGDTIVDIEPMEREWKWQKK